MALRPDDQFYFFLSSDGSMDENPDNKSSDFKISLVEPIEIKEHEEWEVALVDINYPYSWTNVGPVARTVLKYYNKANRTEREVPFPDWHCEKVKDLVEFIEKKFQEFEKKDQPRIWIKLDELKRLKLSCPDEYFDIGLSYPLMRLLGLVGHRYAHLMSLSAFEQRQMHRLLLDFVWREGEATYQSVDLIHKFRTLTYVEDMFEIVRDQVNMEKLKLLVEAMRTYNREGGVSSMVDKQLTVLSKDGGAAWRRIQAMFQAYSTMKLSDSPDSLIKLDFKSLTVKEGRSEPLSAEHEGMGWVIFHLVKLMNLKKPPTDIHAVIPGNLNPVERMFIYTNIIEPVDMNNKPVRLLKMVNTSGKAFSTTQQDFLQPLYLPVKKGRIMRIEVLIMNDQGEPVPFQIGTVMLTLHFRRREARGEKRLRTAVYV